MSRQVNLGQIIPNIQVGETITGNAGTQANVENTGTDLNPILNFTIPKGDTGIQGPQGIAGNDAKINGVNTLTIEAGTNITLDQEGNTLTINSTGGSGGTSDYPDLTNKPKINNVELNGNKTSSDLGLQPAGNYVTNTDYATSSVGGVLKVSNGDYGITVDDGVLKGTVRTYAQYSDMSSKGLVAKGTLENVITGKGLINDSYHDSTKQDITDNTLTTTNKTIPTAINEVNSIAKGANQAVGYNNYSAMITAINAMDDDEYNVGQNVYIVTVNVPDLWVSSVESARSTYTYVDDATVINDLETNGYIQVGYYKLSMLETQKVDLTNYVTNTDYASNATGGVIKTNTNYGTSVDSNGSLRGTTKTYADYDSMHNLGLISKVTLENVITGKGLVSNTDYATSATGGVIRTGASYGTAMASAGILRAVNKTYEAYSDAGDYMFVGKGTLENVITGKGLDLKQLSTFDATKTQVLKNINGTLTWINE